MNFNKMLFLLLVLSSGMLHAQKKYLSQEALNAEFQSLSKTHSNLCSWQTIGTSASGTPIHALTIGSGPADKKPGVLYVGGVEGDELYSSHLVLAFAKKLLSSKDEATASLLRKNSIYLIPSANPDAQSSHFAAIKHERRSNGIKSDADRDGWIGEDPHEDLDKNGMITDMIVRSKAGDWKKHAKYPFVLVAAESTDSIRYMRYTEGTDNDGDKKWNEDDGFGTWVNRNFTYDYMPFSEGAGTESAIAPEVKILMDFLFKRENIHSVFTFSKESNLHTEPKYDAQKAGKRILQGWLENDVNEAAKMVKLFEQIPGAKELDAEKSAGGTFWQTAYYHGGRLSFTAPAWWPFFSNPKADDEKPARGKGKKEELTKEAKFAIWADSMKHTGFFANWTKYNHPDFVGDEVEIGGLHPFVLQNPPMDLATAHEEKYLDFLFKFAQQLPELKIKSQKITKLDGDLYRVEVTLENVGNLPSFSSLGSKTRFVKQQKAELMLDKNQSIVTGNRIVLGDAIPAGATQSYEWLIRGKGNTKVLLGSPTSGFVEAHLEAK